MSTRPRVGDSLLVPRNQGSTVLAVISGEEVEMRRRRYPICVMMEDSLAVSGHDEKGVVGS